MTRFWDWFARLAGIALAIVCVRAVLVERERSLQTPMPQVLDTEQSRSSEDTVTSKTNASAHAVKPVETVLGVAVRLVDRLDEAEISVPVLDELRIRTLLQAHWRKMRSPFVGPRSSVGRLVQQIGLSAAPRPSAERDPSEGHWHADPRLWGLDEGTYDQREAILAPAPSRMSWRVKLPERSVIETAPAAFDGEGEVTFEIAVVASGVRHVIGQRKVAQSKRWIDWRLDLSQFQGDVSVELSTSTAHESPLAAWGSPIVLSPGASRLPYNAVFIVVDAMRGDALASMHDVTEDATLNGAKNPPLDAWLPRMPEVAPNLDKLATRGVTFARAWTTAMWTRPATLAMLTGLRPRRLGLPVLELEPRSEQVRAFYEKHPPLWPLLMRAQGAVTRAVVNNMYLCGYVGVGVDTGFEAMTDYRYLTRDTPRITEDTVEWLKVHRDQRFALFINYASPHAPYVPESEYLQAIEAAPVRPDNKHARRYLAEIRKDDAGIGRVLDQLDALGLSAKTAIVVTADHGETMSEAHDWIVVDVAKGVPSGRFTHLSTMWDEAARVPMLFSLPGRISGNRRMSDAVQTTDIVPTLLDLLGVPIPEGLDGVSLLPVLDGKPIQARPVVVEGRGAESIRDGDWRLIVRSPVARRIHKGDFEFEKALELYNLADDPGERFDVSAANKEVVLQLRAELSRQLSSSRPTPFSKKGPVGGVVRVRFATAGRIAQLNGDLRLAGEGQLKIVSDEPTAIVKSTGPNAFHVAMLSKADATVGIKLLVEPAAADVRWQWTLDGAPWPNTAVFGGPLGVVAPKLAEGLDGVASDELVALQFPYVSAIGEIGMFVARELQLDSTVNLSESAQIEAQQAMQAWGYVRKTEVVKGGKQAQAH